MKLTDESKGRALDSPQTVGAKENPLVGSELDWLK